MAPPPTRGGGGWGPWVGAKKGSGLCLWLVAGPSCPQHSACSPAQGACLLRVRWSARGQKGPAEGAFLYYGLFEPSVRANLLV